MSGIESRTASRTQGGVLDRARVAGHPGAARRRRRDQWVAYGLMAPAVGLVALVMAYPVAWEVWTSLTSFSVRSEGRAFVGLANYQAMLADARFWYALAVTVVYFRSEERRVGKAWMDLLQRSL